MAVPVMMPKQGQSVESCIISQWFKKKGDSVKAGEPLFSYETDKASFEEEAKTDGILLEIFYSDGDEVPVLTNVAVIGQIGESLDAFRPGGSPAPVDVVPAAIPLAAPVVATVTKKRGRPPKNVVLELPEATAPAPSLTPSVTATVTKVKASPRARAIAEKMGINLATVKGTGPNGRIISRDVSSPNNPTPTLPNSPSPTLPKGEGVSASPISSALPVSPISTIPPISPALPVSLASPISPVSPVSEYSDAECEVKKLTNIRKLIAKAMYESLQNSAQLTHHLSADVRKLLALREEVKKALKTDPDYPNITLNDMICWAVIRALEKFPEANSHFLGDSIKTFKKVHLGIAVDTPRGLMVPVLRNAGDLSLKGLSNNLRALADSCRKGAIDPELLQSAAGSFTVSNLGNYGVEMFTPVINLPQVAILGVNTIIQRPADIGGGIMAFVPYIGLSLTYDHRAIDGGPATLFLKEIKNQIETINLSTNFTN